MPRVKLFDEKKVLEKAMHLFWERGFYATSVRDLVNHLGINRASLYNTYGGKRELFNQAFAHYAKTRMEATKEFLDGQISVREGFELLFKQAIQESSAKEKNCGCFVVNTSIELVPNEDDTTKFLVDNKQKFEKIFFDFLSKGVEKGEIPKGKNLKAIAALFFTFYNGLRVITKVDNSKHSACESVDALLLLLE